MYRKFYSKQLAISLSCIIVGYSIGVSVERGQSNHVLPSGYPRSCSDLDGTHCEPLTAKMTEAQAQLPAKLKSIVGDEHVMLSGDSKMAAFTVGARIGKGEALAVCQPGSLKEAVELLRACVAANVAVIPQGRNTGLTGGSVPRSDVCDRPTVVVSMTRLKQIHAVGDQYLCLAGAGIYDLSRVAAAANRESHSILGSLFLNPSVAAGVAFGSGGTQVRKGPAYTERALWCRVTAAGEVELVNTLGLDIKDEDELLRRAEFGEMTAADFAAGGGQRALAPASAAEQYSAHVCRLDGEVARHCADTSGIEPCRSEGKVMILASIHDSFPVPTSKRTLWLSCRSLEQAQALKREVLLCTPTDLPISCEYMDRDCFDVVDSAGRVLCHAIERLGIGERLSRAWGLKLLVESLPLPLCQTLPDKLLYWVNGVLPASLPPAIHAMGKDEDHHLLVSLGEFGSGNLDRTLARLEKFCAGEAGAGVRVHVCSDADTPKVNYFRFAAAPAFRTWCIGHGAQGLSVDYAQAKQDCSAPDLGRALDAAAGEMPLVRMRYAHLGCNVVHEDIAFAEGVDVMACKGKIKRAVEGKGGKLPAEHGHGTEYCAPLLTQERWKHIDPTNTMNPGVGGLPYEYKYNNTPETGTSR